ncbi:MAG: hypothetical protein ABEH80_03400 [Halobaculum sp.]|jgi:hypothetical protein
MTEDDDISEYLDPELDAAIAGTGESDADLPGPLTLPRLVVALHVGAAAGLLPFAVRAAQDGATTQMALFGFVAVAILVSGVAIARITARQY